MPFERLPEAVQTLYAELLELTIHAEAESALLGAPQGTFVAKNVKGGTYWYLQRMEGDRKRQIYLGRESPALLAWIDEVRRARSLSAGDEAQRSKLCSMLAAGGAATERAAVGKILHLLAESGLFRMGGVLVGTQAFGICGNMLGVRFDKQTLRTEDVDLAQDRAIGIALSQETAPVDVARSLTGAGLGFFAVPSLDPRQPSTSFKIRGRELRVDFLTSLVGEDSEAPVFLPSLGVSAHPLRLLDFLIESPAQAVVAAGAGILVNVPDPARYALHKLWISSRRSVSEQTKAAKDLWQAAALLEILLEDRPGDLLVAWDALGRDASAPAAVLLAARRLEPALRDRLQDVLPAGSP